MKYVEKISSIYVFFIVSGLAVAAPASAAETLYAYTQSNDTAGSVVFEAERFHDNVTIGGRKWVAITKSGNSGGGAMVATPASSTRYDKNYINSSPHLDYRISFNKTGKHYVWIRASAPNADSDSLHVGLDGNAIASSDRVVIPAGKGWVWSRTTMDKIPASINISQKGAHTLNLWVREPKLVVDKVMLTTSATYKPNNFGPSVSKLAAIAKQPAVSPIDFVEQDASINGLAVLEAEKFNRAIAVGNHAWVPASNPDAHGTGAMAASPSAYARFDTNYVNDSPHLDFNVKFNRTGIHYIWMRAIGASGSSNSLHFGLDNQVSETSENMEVGPAADWLWSNSAGNATVATINVTKTGLHTVNVWMREAGLILDEIIISHNSGYKPAHTNDAASPTVVPVRPTVNPAANAAEVVPNERVSVSFAGMDGYSDIKVDSLKVFVKDEPVQGVITNKKDGADFSPSRPFAYNVNYSAQVVATLRENATGRLVRGVYDWKFTTINPNADWLVWYEDFNDEARRTYTADDLYKSWKAKSSAGVKEGRVAIVEGDKENNSNVMRIRYEAGKYGLGAGGVQWRTPISRHDELYISYWVKFSDTFNFVRGGKMPGLAGGDANTGKVKPTGYDGWSARMMWRTYGSAVQYMYHPDQPNAAGQDFPWDLNGQRYFTKGQWHKVETRIKMNSPGQRNGIVQSWFDGKLALNRQNVRFRNTNDFAINWFLFSTFFGGSDQTWAAAKQEYAYFDNIIISTKPITH